jgi:hypothetical protein
MDFTLLSDHCEIDISLIQFLTTLSYLGLVINYMWGF